MSRRAGVPPSRVGERVTGLGSFNLATSSRKRWLPLASSARHVHCGGDWTGTSTSVGGGGSGTSAGGGGTSAGGDWIDIHPRCAKEAPPRGGGAGLGAVRGPRRRQRGARPSAHRRRQVRRLTSTNDVGYTYTCPSYPSQRRLLCRPAKGAVADEVSMLVRCAAAVVALLAWRTSATSSARRQVASGSMTMARATAPHLVPRRCRSAPR